MTSDGRTSLVPYLRFPEFRSAGNWHFQPLSDIAEPISDKVGTTNAVPMSVTAGVGLVSQEDKFGRIIAGDSYQNYIRLQTNDFAYNKSATKEFPQGYIARYLGASDAAVPNSIFTCFRPHTAAVIPEYLDHLFHGNYHGRWLRRYITVGARAHGALSVDTEDLMSMPVPLPPAAVSRTEQQRIADCLSSLDNVLAAEGRKLEALRHHKQGLMQQLFPQAGGRRPRLRFPEFQGDGEWKDEKLDTLAKRGTGHTPTKGRAEYYNGGIKWISLADSKRLDKGLISETVIEISEEGIKNSSAVLHPTGSVVLSRDAGVGKSAITAQPMAVSQHFVVWTCEPTVLSNWFLYHQLQLLKPVFERIATGNTIKTIGLPFFDALRIAVPPTLAEQERIADCLCSLDAQLGSQAQKLESLQQHKHGLLQQLFPSLAGPA
jgi:type I restriction enzyme S subunit